MKTRVKSLILVTGLALSIIGSGCATSKTQQPAAHTGKSQVKVAKAAKPEKAPPPAVCLWEMEEGNNQLICQHGHHAMLVRDASTGEMALIRVKPKTATVVAAAPNPAPSTPVTTTTIVPASTAVTTAAAPEPTTPPNAGPLIAGTTPAERMLPMEPHGQTPAPAVAEAPDSGQGGGGGGGTPPAVDPPAKKPAVTPSHGRQFVDGDQFQGHIDGTVGAWFSEGKSGTPKKSQSDMIVLWDAGARWDPGQAGSGLFLGAHSLGIYSPTEYGSGPQSGTFCYEYKGSQGNFWEPHSGTVSGWERELLLGNAMGEIGFSKFPYLSLIGGAVYTDQDIRAAVGVGIEYSTKWLDLRADPMFIPDGSDFAFMGRLMLKPTRWFSIGGVAHIVGDDYAVGPMARVDLYHLVGGKSPKFSLGVDGGYLWSSLNAPSGWSGSYDQASIAGQRTDAPWTGNYTLKSSSGSGSDSQRREGAFVGVSARWTF